MKTIHKYCVHHFQLTGIPMPRDAKIIKVDQQGNLVHVWAEIQSNGFEIRHFQLLGTGQIIPEDKCISHVGTVLMPDGFVWHLYEFFGEKS